MGCPHQMPVDKHMGCIAACSCDAFSRKVDVGCWLNGQQPFCDVAVRAHANPTPTCTCHTHAWLWCACMAMVRMRSPCDSAGIVEASLNVYASASFLSFPIRVFACHVRTNCTLRLTTPDRGVFHTQTPMLNAASGISEGSVACALLRSSPIIFSQSMVICDRTA
eukprot:353638-Chlamydomonas_euryale.AAC.2